MNSLKIISYFAYDGYNDFIIYKVKIILPFIAIGLMDEVQSNSDSDKVRKK